MVLTRVREDVQSIKRRNRTIPSRRRKINQLQQKCAHLESKLKINYQIRGIQSQYVGGLSTIAPFTCTQQGEHLYGWKAPSRYISTQGVGSDPSAQEGRLMEVDIEDPTRNPQDKWIIFDFEKGKTVSKYHDKLYYGEFTEEEGERLLKTEIMVCERKNGEILVGVIGPRKMFEVAHYVISYCTSPQVKTMDLIDFAYGQVMVEMMKFLCAPSYSYNQHNIMQIYVFHVSDVLETVPAIVRLCAARKFGEIILGRKHRSFYALLAVFLNENEFHAVLGGVRWILTLRRKVVVNRIQQKIMMGSSSNVGEIQKRTIPIKFCRSFYGSVRFVEKPLKDVFGHYAYDKLF